MKEKLDDAKHEPFIDAGFATPWRKRGDYDPYVSLWMSVLQLAISDSDSTYESLRRPAREWIFSADKTPGSFRWICDHVGLDWMILQSACISKTKRQALVKSQEKSQKDVQKLKARRKVKQS